MFGFGQKQIDIALEKLNYSEGETIKGKVILNLKNPTHASALNVGIVGERLERETIAINGRLSTNRRIETVFSFNMPLDGEKDYSQGEYNFEMKVPAGIARHSMPEETVMKTLQILSGGRESDVRWYVTAKLDIHMRLDIKTRVQINIG